MILDSAELEPGATLHADLCIVGAGAAGIALALQFEGTGTQIVLLDSGGEAAEPATQALAEGELAPGCRHPPPHRYRPRRFGGATTLWGGRCMPLDPIDFAAREWVPHSGWPIGPDDLAAYYPAANHLCEAGDFAYMAARDMPPILHGFAGTHFTDAALERFSCPTDFAARYRSRLAAAANIRVVLHATAVRIATSDAGRRASFVQACAAGGGRLDVRAENIVLAAGGLEVPRLLLASGSPDHPGGVGNAHDAVGRYYMCHLAGTLGMLRPRVRVDHGYSLSDEGVYCRRRFAITGAAQLRLRTGNMVARLHHPRIGDPAHGSGALSLLRLAAPFIAPEYATRLQDGPAGAATLARHAINMAATPLHTADFMLHWLRHRTLAARKFPSIIVRPPGGTYSLDVHAEQFPNAHSRVTLGAGRDALGMPRLRVDWRHLPADIETVRRGLHALSADLSASGTAQLAWDEDALEDDLLRDGAYGGHHIGTARMSADPRSGVVDADCRVHGVANLWIAGSAVFPTSGQANPTLTIVALALRLAARLAACDDHCSPAKPASYLRPGEAHGQPARSLA